MGVAGRVFRWNIYNSAALARSEGTFQRRRKAFSCRGRRQPWGFLAVECFGQRRFGCAAACPMRRCKRWGGAPCCGNVSIGVRGKAGRVPCEGVRFRGGCQAGACSSACGVLAVTWAGRGANGQASVFGQGSPCQLGEHIVFRPWRFRLAVERVRCPTPRAADPPVGGGKVGAVLGIGLY